MSTKRLVRPDSLEVEELTLANGLRVLMQPDRRLPLVALQVTYRAGSRHDPNRRWGMAHLCEHLLYSGWGESAGFPERFRLLGGRPAAVTSFDRTRYSVLLPTRQLPEGLAIEAERMALTAGGRDWSSVLARERRVLLAERRERFAGRPRGRALEQIHRLLFPPRHPYRRPPGGMTTGIRAITEEELATFLSQRYSPDNAILVLTGDLPAATARWVTDTFGTIPSGPGCEGNAVEAIERPRERRSRLTHPGASSGSYVAFRIETFSDEALCLASLLALSSAVGRSCPLRRALVEETGVARALSTFLTPMRDVIVWTLAATAAPGVAPQRLTESLVETLTRWVCDGVNEWDLRRARKKALSDHYVNLQVLERRANLLARSVAFRDRPPSQAPDPWHVPEIDACRLDAFAARWCQPQNRAVLTVVPDGIAA